MSNLLKIALPLLNENITLKDISPETGFVDAYFEDINRPSLCQHLFLMYEATKDTKEAAERFHKFKNLNNLYSVKVIYVDKKPYTLYTFTTNRVINDLRDGNILLSPSRKQRVLDFWQWKDGWIRNNVLMGLMYTHPEPSSVPEEDYAPEFFEDEKGEALL